LLKVFVFVNDSPAQDVIGSGQLHFSLRNKTTPLYEKHLIRSRVESHSQIQLIADSVDIHLIPGRGGTTTAMTQTDTVSAVCGN
jgi:hypothetical protein